VFEFALVVVVVPVEKADVLNVVNVPEAVIDVEL
jgi:hypothetical protein